MFGLIYGLIDGSTSGWTATSWQVLGAAVIFLILFGWRQAAAKNPLILRSLLHNHGFTSGLLVGLGYFAAVNGFAYVISLYFQLGLGFKPAGAALAMSPMMIGIVISSFIARPLIPKLGRRLVAVALAVTLLAVVGMLATGFVMGTATCPAGGHLRHRCSSLGTSAWAQAFIPSTTSPSATCDRRKQAAQAAPCPPCNRSPTPSDPLSVTTIYFSAIATHGQLQGFLATLGAICAVLLICLAAKYDSSHATPQRGTEGDA